MDTAERPAIRGEPRISLIVAMSSQGVIGAEGGLPWHLPEDLRRFKRLTMGHALVMGRKTYESIGRPLPGRTSIVITRQTSWHAAPEVRTVDSFESAVALVRNQPEIAQQREQLFVVGGAQIYALALPHVSRMYVTRIAVDVPGDTHFPNVDWSEWELTSSEAFASPDQPDCCFQIYERKAPAV